MTVHLICFKLLRITAPSSQAKGRLFLRLGIMLTVQITKTIKGSTKCNYSNEVICGKHMTSSPFQDFPEGMKSM